jgi:UDP-N-acetylmuramoyl-tripeptide--D-alanyl-D-alanine ligase
MRASLAQLVASLSGARMNQNVAFDGVSTDSRTLAPGELFVALRGEHFDGHDFLPKLAEMGVGAVIAEKLPPGWTLRPSSCPTP